MTWYIEKSNKVRKEMAEKSCLEIPHKLQTTTLSIIDMNTQEDYDRIAAALLKMTGVEKISLYNNSHKIFVTFDTRLIGIEHIVYTISQIGYHYVNRF